MMYERFKLIDGEDNLAGFFNYVMTHLTYMRELVAPYSFHKQEEIADFQDGKFCDFCRYELWMHGVAERVREWVSDLSEYFGEFEGSWRYYAESKRLEYLRTCSELGGEDDDDDDYPDGEDADCGQFSIISDLYIEDSLDIVQNTAPNDLQGLCADIIAVSRIDILEGLRKSLGTEIEPYIQDKDGTMRKMTMEERDLNMVSRQVDAEDDAKLILAVDAAIHAIIEIIKECKDDDDNTEALQTVLKASKALLGMDFKELDSALRAYKKEKDDADNIHDGAHTD